MSKENVIDKLVEMGEKIELPVLIEYVFGNNINVKLWYSLEDCQESIDELNLSVRSQNALKRANILTLNDLIEKLNEGNLKGIRNLGKKSYSEIQTKMLVYGYENLSAGQKRNFFKHLLADYE